MKPRDIWQRMPVPPEHVIGIAAGWALHRLRPARSSRRLAPVGWLLVGAGVATSGWAVAERGGGDLEDPQRLVTTGLHGVTRHPMYVGWSLIHFGLGLAGRMPWVLVTWPASAALIHMVVLGEEMEMLARFGEEYEDYGTRVPRYLGDPRPGRRRDGG